VLNDITHPLIHEHITVAERAAIAARGPSTIVVHDIALLAEGQRASDFDVVAEVDVPPEVQVARRAGQPPTIMVWHSVRATGDTKTRKSRRTLELPQRCVDALRLHRKRQDQIRSDTSGTWQDNDLVFCTLVGTALDAANVRRSFRSVVKAAGLKPC
jgi:hypothetical protein